MYSTTEYLPAAFGRSDSRSLRHLIETAKERGLIDEWSAEGTRLIFRTGAIRYRVSMGQAADLLTGLNAAYEQSEILAYTAYDKPLLKAAS